MFPLRSLLIPLVLSLSSALGAAQTNAPSPAFQGFRPGDLVKVQCQKPLVLLGQALFESQTASNIVFLSKGERFTLDKNGLVLSPVKLLNTPSPSPAAITPQPVQSTGPDMQLLLLGVQQQVLGNYSNQKGYAEATKYYQENIHRYLKGDLTVDQIVEQATRTLQQVDQFMPERAKDPQYEPQIQFLRDFVERARNGEKADPTGRPE